MKNFVLLFIPLITTLCTVTIDGDRKLRENELSALLDDCVKCAELQLQGPIILSWHNEFIESQERYAWNLDMKLLVPSNPPDLLSDCNYQIDFFGRCHKGGTFIRLQHLLQDASSHVNALRRQLREQFFTWIALTGKPDRQIINEEVKRMNDAIFYLSLDHNISPKGRLMQRFTNMISSFLLPNLNLQLKLHSPEKILDISIGSPGFNSDEIFVYLDLLRDLRSLDGVKIRNVFGLLGVDLLLDVDVDLMKNWPSYQQILRTIISIAGSNFASLQDIEQDISATDSQYFPLYFKVLIYKDGQLCDLRLLSMPYKEYLGKAYPSVLILRDSLIHAFSPDKRRKFYPRSLPLLTVLNNEQHIVPEGSLFKLLPKELFNTIMNMVHEDKNSWIKLRWICKNFPIKVEKSFFDYRYNKMSLWNPICEDYILEFIAAVLITESSGNCSSGMGRLSQYIVECFPRKIIDIGILLEKLKDPRFIPVHLVIKNPKEFNSKLDELLFMLLFY
jgi:hypothetical protein